MKIKSIRKPYPDVAAMPRASHKNPRKPSRLLAALIRFIGASDLKDVNFSYTTENMEKAGDGPWFVLMNHSSFLDLEMVAVMLKNKPYQIVCTSDGLVGKEGLMRAIGCIPTQKFVSDIGLIGDLKYAFETNGTSVLMFPEASYSFDGTATPLPRKMGILFKGLKVPVVMITTFGSFARDPLYNNLQKRKVDVTAKMECLLSVDEIAEKSVVEIDEILDRAFSFDYFRWQEENGIEINEPFRADGLNRILYKCPSCMNEGETEGKGTKFVCNACGKSYEMDTLGRLIADDGKNTFTHIPDWYAWEREMVRNEILSDRYALDTEVEIGMVIDYKAVYMVGEGTLHHDRNGFRLTGCEGQLHYAQPVPASYSLYSDYFWYEIGDVICIGNKDALYYCFPKKKDVVAKTRIAAEELYKIDRENKAKTRRRKES